MTEYNLTIVFLHAPSILVLMVMMIVGLVMLSFALSASFLLANCDYLVLMLLMTLYCLTMVCFRAQAILIPSFYHAWATFFYS